MSEASTSYGLWFLVLLNSAVFILFAFSFFNLTDDAINLTFFKRRRMITTNKSNDALSFADNVCAVTLIAGCAVTCSQTTSSVTATRTRD